MILAFSPVCSIKVTNFFKQVLTLGSFIVGVLFSSHTLANEIDVDITTRWGDQQVYTEGEKLSFLVSLNKSAYLFIFYIDAAGKILQLMPNDHQTNHLFQPGLYIEVPNRQSPFELVVGPPFGIESVWVFAIDALKKGEQIDTETFALPDFQQAMRSYAIQNKADFGEATLNLSTKAR